MNKYYGIFSSFLQIPLFIGIWQLYNLFEFADDFWDNWSPFLILSIIFYSIFGSFIKITNGKIKICRLLWFLHKKNTFEIDEIHKVYIRNGGQARGASVSVEFFDKHEKYVGGLLCQMLNFELRRLKKRLERLAIEVEIDEIRGHKI